jgi:hypothetical protein
MGRREHTSDQKGRPQRHAQASDPSSLFLGRAGAPIDRKPWDHLFCHHCDQKFDQGAITEMEYLDLFPGQGNCKCAVTHCVSAALT